MERIRLWISGKYDCNLLEYRMYIIAYTAFNRHIDYETTCESANDEIKNHRKKAPSSWQEIYTVEWSIFNVKPKEKMKFRTREKH